MPETAKDDEVIPRIMGTFIKQVWGGHRDQEAIESSKIEFDATDAILAMPHSELISLQDHRENTDRIGELYIQWDGPFEVEVVDSILEYFEVDSLACITAEMLQKANQQAGPAPFVMETLTLMIKVNVRKAPGADLTDFIENLDYSVQSNTLGVVVTNTEIIDSEVKEKAEKDILHDRPRP